MLLLLQLLVFLNLEICHFLAQFLHIHVVLLLLSQDSRISIDPLVTRLYGVLQLLDAIFIVFNYIVICCFWGHRFLRLR